MGLSGGMCVFRASAGWANPIDEQLLTANLRSLRHANALQLLVKETGHLAALQTEEMGMPAGTSPFAPQG